MDLSVDEVIETVRDMFPREYQIVVLTVANKQLAARVAELEATQPQEPDTQHAATQHV